MSQANFRPAGLWVMFEGQSLNNYPAAPDNMPSVLMADFPTSPFLNARNNVSIDSTSMTTLATTAAERLHQYANVGLVNVLIVNGGTSDIWNNDSAATLMADFVACAQAAKAAGFDKVIPLTLTGNSTNTGGQNTIRLAFNVLLLADAGGDFDGVADVAGNANMDDHTDATYFTAGLHWTAAGAAVAAGVVAPVLTAAIA